MVHILYFLFLGLSDVKAQKNPNPDVFNIGGVLSNNESIFHFKDIIDVYAVVVSHPITGDLSPAAVSYTCGFYHIPVIGISSRDSAFSDKNIHVSFLRTVPPYSHQADVWVELLKHFNYKKVIFIHSSDTDGRALLGRFQTTSQSLEDDIEIKVQVESVVEFEPGLESFTDLLLEMKNAQARVYLMYSSKTDAEVIFRDAAWLNMTDAGYAWIVTEQALDAKNVPDGILGLQLVNSTNEKAHIQDSMRQILLNGETGKVAFDDQGDRINAEYNIINIQRLKQSRKNQVEVGKYFFNKETNRMQLNINEKSIIWPGRLQIKPEGFMIPTHLKVLTIEEKPFVYARKLNDDQENCTPEEIPCPHFNFTQDGKKEWTGLIGELVGERADMIVAPLTINPERAEFIEFSKPFKYQGITILEKRSSTLVSFLQPFSNTLWILVMVSVHVVALVLYLLDRFSPFGRFKLANTDGTEEDALNLSSAIWFAWGVLLNSGIGEGTPRSFSARVLGMVWAGFAMIIVASYTANLAAFLVLERPKTKLTGINDARLRNTMENLTCATVKGSAVDMYFRRQVELSNMYRTMEANNYNTAEDAIHDVKIGKLMAFIWDSSRLEFEAAQDCELVTAGELFGRSGYGIGGFMESLDNRWILQGNIQQCEQFEKTPNTLGLKNMAGVFILVAAGIVGGIGLIVIEMAYKKHQIKKQKRMELARHAADKWRGKVEKRKTLRQSIATQRRIKSNGVNEPMSISLTVDTKYPRVCTPERGWPGDSDIRLRRLEDSGGVQPVPRHLPAYTPDVSHLII
ncbi:ionotropic glutamate receptor [Holotrichia oblita]|uniref:Ionotropic glutamate receptor n=1 Tax=Holotrichia oblita TaxID=644536 RepID=A0ACB9T2H4_HOLOL|nr:ionotropic glutamate receptor [Holotrichia oblita]